MSSIKHVAIIPDGNRRWAKSSSLTTPQGHEAGFEALRRILKECKDSGPTILSFYAFSTENFNRSQVEVNQLFNLLENVLENFSKELKENKIQLRISGSQQNLSKKLIQKLSEATQLCSEGDFILNICFNYGAQEEFVKIGKEIAQKAQKNEITEKDIDLAYISSHLWNGDLPPVDLLIRTSGEYRISNFMLWQCAYAEFYFSPRLWPDFSPQDFLEALEAFEKRQRRYGK